MRIQLALAVAFMAARCGAYLPAISPTRRSARLRPSPCNSAARQPSMCSASTAQGFPNIRLAVSPAQGKRALAWGIFSAGMFAVRDFYPIIIGTFFLSYLGTSVVNKIDSFKSRVGLATVPRKVFAALYMVSLVSFVSFGVFAVSPRVLKEAQNCLAIVQSENPYKIIADAITGSVGEEVSRRLEQLLAYLMVSAGIVRQAANEKLHLEKLLQHAMQHYTEGGLAFGSRLISQSTSILYSAVLSCVLSFMVVWDLPVVSSGLRMLRGSRLGFVYSEVAPKARSFGKLLGQSFEVQALTSLVNCALTTLVLLALRIPGIGFFSVLTFFSSFVPILGIAISTVPPLLVALVEFGLERCFQLLLLVAGVHAAEAYLIYPQIYAARLKMHPLLVTTALILAEHFAGIGGLLLAVPVTLFVVNQLVFDSAKTSVPALAPAQSEQ